MQDEVITSLDQVNAAWLTGVLQRSGALEQGAVATFDWITRVRELSTSAKLNVQYTTGAQGELPQRLFLKLVNINMEDEFFGPSEVNYYIRDYVDLQGAPILRCYDAAFSAQQQRYHILMDDVSETHVEVFAKEPTLEYGLALAEALAKLHAHWWGAERLRAGGEPIPSAQTIQRFVDIARPGVNHVLARCADQLAAHWPQTIRDLFEWHPPAMIKRTQNGAGFTLIHGDVNAGNVFVPIAGDRPLFIVDRQPFDWSLTTWLGVYDLSYAIVHRWEVETRRKFEQQILRHYHAQLLANGVQDYSWAQLFADYRLCAVISVYVAIEWSRGGISEETLPIWLPMLQKTMTAFDDLDCAKLAENDVCQQPLVEPQGEVSMSEEQEKTISTAIRAAQENPTNSELQVALGMAYFYADRLDAAMDAFQQAIALNPATATAYNGIGRVYYTTNPQAAIGAYEQAIALDPHYIDPIYGLGILYSARLGKYADAVAAFQRGLAHNPDDAFLIASLGSTYARMGRFDEAIAALQRAATLDPNQTFAQGWLSILLLHLKRYDEAIVTCQREIEIEDAHSPRRMLGYIYDWMGDYDEAIVQLERSIALDPSDYEARGALAKVYRLAGRQQDATEQHAIANAMAQQDNEYGQACFAAVSGDVEQALVLLEVGLAKGQLQPGWARIDPEFAFMTDDPRFKALIGA